jgi:ParB family chromosome partitioning protein
VQERHAGESSRKAKSSRAIDPETEAMIRALTNRLRQHFTTHVSISYSAKKGRLELEYYGNDDLERLLTLMGVSLEGL